MSNIRSGSTSVASTDYNKRNYNVPQDHEHLGRFKMLVANSTISRIFIGWRSLITGEKESNIIHAFNILTSAIPVFSRKIFQHSLICCWLENGRHIIVEYGAYNQHYDNAPFNTQIYYWKKREYGLRLYEDPNDIFFNQCDFLEIQFNDQGKTFREIIDHLCSFDNYSKKNYDLIDLNCQRFCQNFIYYVNGKRFPGRNYRGNHTLSFAIIPAYIAYILERNENDDSNLIGYIPIIGDFIDIFRA